jgi:peptide/nickel transport system substrate-binding protein
MTSKATRLVALIVLSIGLAACDVTVPGSDAGQPKAPVATATPDPNTLVWGVAEPPGTLDPARMLVDPAANQIAGQVYDQLLRLRPGTAELMPGIAADWDADRQGRTYSFTLREGLRFHDGTPLDAAAVSWNFNRWMKLGHPQHQGEFRAWLSLFGGFEGQRDSEGRETNLVEKVEAVDPLTVRVTLRAPFAPFLYHLALVPFGMASPTAVRAQGERYGSDGEHLPVGSGPFRVVAWSGDGTVYLDANREYWAGPPKVPALRFVAIPDAARRIEAVASGAVHGAPLEPTTVVTAPVSGVAFSVLPRPARTTAWLTLNMSRAPLDDVRVRQAIDMAIDRQQLAREHFGPEALPSGQLLPPVFMGHDLELGSPPYDPERAKALLAESGHSDGFQLNIWVPNTARAYLPDPVGTADAVATMLKAVGIDARVRTEGLRQFLSDRDTGRFTAWIIGWEAQSVDPDNFWFFHFGAGRAPSEGQYANADLARSVLEAQRTLGAAERTSLYRSAAQTVAADVARVFLAYTRPLVMKSDRVTGYVPGLMGFDDLATVTLGPAPPGATAAPIPTGPGAVLTPSAPGTETLETPGTPGAELTATLGTPGADVTATVGTPGTPGADVTATPGSPGTPGGTPAALATPAAPVGGPTAAPGTSAAPAAASAGTPGSQRTPGPPGKPGAGSTGTPRSG